MAGPAGSFEVLHLPHWSRSEMRAAFGFTLDQYLFYGVYPDAASLAGDPERWARYIRGSLIETTIARDVLVGSGCVRFAPIAQPDRSSPGGFARPPRPEGGFANVSAHK